MIQLSNWLLLTIKRQRETLINSIWTELYIGGNELLLEKKEKTLVYISNIILKQYFAANCVFITEMKYIHANKATLKAPGCNNKYSSFFR